MPKKKKTNKIKSASPIKSNALKAKEEIEKAARIINKLSDVDKAKALGNGALNYFLLSILNPDDKNDYNSIYDFLLQNKYAAQLLAFVRYAIINNYGFEGKVNGHKCFISPTHFQFFEDGVMFTQGETKTDGLIGRYKDGKVKFAIVARDILGGEELGPNDFLFLDPEEYKNNKYKTQTINEFESAIQELKELLKSCNNKEEKYQKYLENNPWIFGLQYKEIQKQTKLDDENIPDFTAVRSHDSHRDIIEIKPPFTSMFKEKNNFNSEFNDSWNQIERYLKFTRKNAQYLYDNKGLLFSNPKCYLILGYSLSEQQRKKLSDKQEMNPAITILTYNDLQALATNTLDKIKQLSKSYSDEEKRLSKES